MQEYGLKFWINLQDYLDTGLFLDHRETRKLVAAQSKDKRLLNLFSYTASFSVHAAAAGATFTKSVDMSNTYCDWAKNNFDEEQQKMMNNVISAYGKPAIEMFVSVKNSMIQQSVPTSHAETQNVVETLADLKAEYDKNIDRIAKDPTYRADWHRRTNEACEREGVDL